MPTYTITLQGPDGTTERLLYDPHASLLTHDDGRPVDLSPAGFVYGGKSGWETAMAVSPENPGLKTRTVRKLVSVRATRPSQRSLPAVSIH